MEGRERKGRGAPDTEEILNHWASQYGAHRN